jgi:hypothetical protein
LRCGYLEGDVDVVPRGYRIRTDVVCGVHQRLGGLPLHAWQADVEMGREPISALRSSQINFGVDGYVGG